MVSARPVILLTLTTLTLLAFACGGGGGKKDQPPEATATAPAGDPAQLALAQFVQTTLQKPFVPDCTKTDVANDKDKVCATLMGQRDPQQAYKLGPTFSEPNLWVILEQRGAQYAVVASFPINADTAAVPGIPWPLRTGVDLVVAGASPCVNVREGPSLNQKAVDCIKDGSKVRLTAGPTAADGINWWQVEGRTGWVAGDYLRYPDAAQ